MMINIRSLIRSSLIAGFLVCTFPALNFNSAYCADYYVDMTSGNDSNKGSISSPWKSIDRAKRSSGTVQPGDTVYIRSVTYQFTTQRGVQFDSGDSGQSGSPITYKAFTGETVSFSGIGSTTSAIFFINNTQYLVFDGFRFTGTYPQIAETRAFNIAGGGNITIKNCNVVNIYKGIAFGDVQIDNIIITGNTFDGNAAPVYINQNKNVTISGNTFKYTYEGLKINPHYLSQTAENIDIYGNFFYQIGWGFKDSDGTDLGYYNPGIIIDHQCNICGAGDSYTKNVNIYSNIFWGCSDAGIRTQRADVDIYNNTFYRQHYYDAHVLNNTVGGHGVGIVIQNGVYVSKIKNNIFYDNKGWWDGTNDIVAENGSTYNASNNLLGNPIFVNGDPIAVNPYDPNNYKLSSGSKNAIDKGADLSSEGITKDYFGNQKPLGSGYDIGAHEYSSGAQDYLAPVTPQGLIQR